MSKKTLYFDKILNYTVAAATENGRLVNCDIEKGDSLPAEGNIYKGIVTDVLDGMQAAFVDCGLERSCYLPAEDSSPYSEKTESRITLKKGDGVIVQVVKPPMGKKGAKVTTRLSFVGKSIIYMPQTEFIGVSNKIKDEELRANLMMEARSEKRKGEGIVVRSAAPFYPYGKIKKELEYLRDLFSTTMKEAENIDKGLIYCDYALPLRVLRDNNTGDVERIIIGNEELWKKVNALPLLNEVKLELYAGTRDMLDEYGIALQIHSALLPKVEIEGGANLVIERTEALTVIDVNTGKFVGDDNLEQTVYQTNLAAAREIARQVRLRNIGGIVVVDFIDMKEANHRKALAYELEKALQKDPCQCKVLPMSEFGLIEFTRKRTGSSLGELMTNFCKPCGGNKCAVTDEVIMMYLRSEILRHLSDGAECVLVECDLATAEYAAARKDLADDLRERFPSASACVRGDEARGRRDISFKALKCRPQCSSVKFIY